MISKHDAVNPANETVHEKLVVWSKKYSVGIELIDNQHRELVNLTNELFQACLSPEKELETTFKETMSRMVEYVRFHFATEADYLKKINFPGYQNHIMLHDQLVKKILDAVKDYNDGKKYVPNSFVRTLKDWVFGHIAVYDQIYASHVKDKVK